MAVEDEKIHTPHATDKGLESGSNGSEHKKAAVGGYIPHSDEEYVVTWKTWAVVWILAWSYGISFWIVPAASSAQAVIATALGDVTKQAWVRAQYSERQSHADLGCACSTSRSTLSP